MQDFAGPSTVAMDVSKEIRGTGHFSAHFPSDVDLIETPRASPTIPNAKKNSSQNYRIGPPFDSVQLPYK